MSKCFCHFNGYEVKDAYARNSIETLNNSVDGLNSSVDTLNKYTNQSNNKIIVISDSYGDGYVPSEDTPITNTFIEYFKNMIQYEDVNFLSSSVGGTGFYATDGSNRNWLNLLTELVSNLSNEDKQNVKEVYFIGGFNDTKGTYDQITTNINSVYEYINNNLPNAKMITGMVGYYSLFNQHLTRKKLSGDVLSAYSQTFTDKPKYLYLDGIENILHNCMTLSSDGIHPNNKGHKELARFLYCYKNGVKYYDKNYRNFYDGYCRYSYLSSIKPGDGNYIEVFKYVYGNITQFLISASLYTTGANLNLTNQRLVISDGSVDSSSPNKTYNNLTCLNRFQESGNTFVDDYKFDLIQVYKSDGTTINCSGRLYIDASGTLTIEFSDLDTSITSIKGFVINRQLHSIATQKC